MKIKGIVIEGEKIPAKILCATVHQLPDIGAKIQSNDNPAVQGVVRELRLSRQGETDTVFAMAVLEDGRGINAYRVREMEPAKHVHGVLLHHDSKIYLVANDGDTDFVAGQVYEIDREIGLGVAEVACLFDSDTPYEDFAGEVEQRASIGEFAIVETANGARLSGIPWWMEASPSEVSDARAAIGLKMAPAIA